MSAVEEDTELRDLVTQTLENNGLLGKIQAQLRAGVFLALEETDKKNRKVHHNKRLQQFLSTKDGLLAAGIVQEFLEFFQLDYTGAVFEPESGMSGKYEGRAALEQQVDYDVSDDLPLLAAIIKQSSTGHNVHLGQKSNSQSSGCMKPSVEDLGNDSMDFLNRREPLDDMISKYASNSQDEVQVFKKPVAFSPPHSEPISEAISEQISEHLNTEQDNSTFHDSSQADDKMHSTKEWDKEMENLDNKLENIGIKTPTDVGGEKTYDDDFEKTDVTEEISAISEIDNWLQTSEKYTDKAGDDSMLTSDHTISVDSVGDVDYVEDVTF